MAIRRAVRLNDCVRKLRALKSASGRVAGGKMKPGRTTAMLTSMVLVGAVVKFNEVPPDAQASLLDDTGRTARMISDSPLSSTLATDDEGTGGTAGPRMLVPMAAQGTEGNDAAPRRVAARAKPAFMNPLWELPLEQLSTTRERPIFSPS